MKKHDLPAQPFYWGDWFKAMDLQSLPRETRCVWFEMLGRMWESNERGYLTINGKPMSNFAKANALAFGSAVDEYLRHERILEEHGIFSRRESDGAIYCRKILNDIDLSEKRAKSGSKGGRKTWQFAKANAMANGKANTEDESEYEIEDVNEVFQYFCLKLNKKILLSPEREEIIAKRLKEKRTVKEMKIAIDNFSRDSWEGRTKYWDIVYCLGTRSKVNNLDRWLNFIDTNNPESSSKMPGRL